jgi:hypothetical protein
MKSSHKASLISAINRLEEDSTAPVVMFWIDHDGRPSTFISGAPTSLVMAVHNLLGKVIQLYMGQTPKEAGQYADEAVQEYKTRFIDIDSKDTIP